MHNADGCTDTQDWASDRRALFALNGVRCVRPGTDTKDIVMNLGLLRTSALSRPAPATAERSRAQRMDDLPDLIIGHYERHALEWEADRRNGGWNDKPWHDRFVSALPTGARVLDLGCGGGAPVAANMARCGLRITGVDASPTLISLRRERMPDQELPGWHGREAKTAGSKDFFFEKKKQKTFDCFGCGLSAWSECNG